MKADLSGKTAVVTGASQGIGKAIAKSLLENSATVVMAARSVDKLKKNVEEFSSIGPCQFIPADVSSKESVDNLIDSVVKEHKRIDILVNNAGINTGSIEERVDVSEYSVEDWDKIMAVNLNGVFYCSQAASKVMIKQKSGRIINIGSAFGTVAARNQIGFVAAKGGMHHMTKGMALELGSHGITVNCIAPGSIQMGMNMFSEKDSPMADLQNRMLSHVPLGRFGTVEDVANAVLFLSADESDYITGQVLMVDGGWTCGYARDF